MRQPAPRVLSVASFDAPHVVAQARVGEFAAGLFGASLPDIGRLITVFTNGGISTRRFVEPPEWYRERRSWPEKNATYVRHARALGVGAARAALARAGLTPEAIGAVVFVSTTGIATPSVHRHRDGGGASRGSAPDPGLGPGLRRWRGGPGARRRLGHRAPR